MSETDLDDWGTAEEWLRTHPGRKEPRSRYGYAAEGHYRRDPHLPPELSAHLAHEYETSEMDDGSYG